MQAILPQRFVFTRQFGTFALYSYTIQRPTLVGDYAYEERGPNPTVPIRSGLGGERVDVVYLRLPQIRSARSLGAVGNHVKENIS